MSEEEERGKLSDVDKELNEYYRATLAELNKAVRENHRQYNTIIMSISSAIITFSTLNSKCFSNPILLKWANIALGIAVILLTVSFLIGNKNLKEEKDIIHSYIFKGQEFKTTKWEILTVHLNCLSAGSFIVGLFLFIFSK